MTLLPIVAGPLLLAISLGATAVQARPQDSPTKSAEKFKYQRSDQAPQTQTDSELAAILDMAASLPPELNADILLRLVESGKLTDRALTLDLLTRAFDLAESAQQPVKRSSMPGAMVDTRSGYLSRAFELKLDRLSLQLRAVNLLLKLDTTQAREHFERIRFPDLAPLDCEEPLLYDLSLYYQTLANVIRKGFAPEEKEKGLHLSLLRASVSDLRSHAQLEPVANLLRELDLPPQDLREMLNLFAYSLRRLSGDNRSFAATGATIYGYLSSLTYVIGPYDAKGIGSAVMLQATRDYLVSNLSGVRCGDTLRRTLPRDPLPEPIRFFNQYFQEGLRRAHIAPIDAEELRNWKAGPSAKISEYWQAPPEKELMAAIKRLRFGNGNTPLTTQERATPAWTADLADFLKKLEAWKPDTEDSVADFFHEKCVLYYGLIDLIPAQPERLKAMDAYVRFLELNSVQRSSTLEWFLHVTELLGYAAKAEEPARNEILQSLSRSRDVTLNVYAHLEHWAPQDTSRRPH